MAEMMIWGTMAAFGLLSLVWAGLGWLLPGGKGAAVVCWGEPDVGILSRVKWLQGLGLLHCPMLIIAETDETCDPNNGIEYCSPENLLSRLEQERKESDGTGNGDSSGHHRCGGVPEL